MAEHLKSVQMELVHTQSLVDAKNKEIETEEHMKQITERQSGRLKNEIEKLDNKEIKKLYRKIRTNIF